MTVEKLCDWFFAEQVKVAFRGYVSRQRSKCNSKVSHHRSWRRNNAVKFGNSMRRLRTNSGMAAYKWIPSDPFARGPCKTIRKEIRAIMVAIRPVRSSVLVGSGDIGKENKSCDDEVRHISKAKEGSFGCPAAVDRMAYDRIVLRIDLVRLVPNGAIYHCVWMTSPFERLRPIL